jgi:hypothetical protein
MCELPVASHYRFPSEFGGVLQKNRFGIELIEPWPQKLIRPDVRDGVIRYRSLVAGPDAKSAVARKLT